MLRLTATASALLLMSALVTNAHPQPLSSQAGTLSVQPAIDGIMVAFKTRPIVAIGDEHGVAQEMDFYAALIRDPRFAREVGNVVVEFGSALHQDIIDRYVAGEEVPYTEFRKVWTDAVGWSPTVTYVGLPNVFAQIRAANRGLPPQERIRVWLGEPPADWSRILSRADLEAAEDQRDRHAASVIIDNVLSKNRRALVIYGYGHFIRERPASRPQPRPNSEAVLRAYIAGAQAGRLDPALLGGELTPAWPTPSRGQDNRPWRRWAR